MKLLRPVCVVMFLTCFGVSDVRAQFGGILDKLQKLSGPEFYMYTAFARWGYQPGQAFRANPFSRIDLLRNRLVGGLTPVGRERLTTFSECVNAIGASRVIGTRGYYDEGRVDRVRARLERVERRLERLALRMSEPRSEGAILNDILQLENDVCRAQLEFQVLDADSSLADPFRGLTWRAGIGFGHDYGANEAGINVWSVAVAPEYRFTIGPSWLTFGLGSGVHFYHFYDGGIDDFKQFSFPLEASWQPFARSVAGFARNLRIAYGFHIFPPFESDAFAPVLPQIEEGWEVVWLTMPSISFDISLTSLPFFFR